MTLNAFHIVKSSICPFSPRILRVGTHIALTLISSCPPLNMLIDTLTSHNNNFLNCGINYFHMIPERFITADVRC